MKLVDKNNDQILMLTKNAIKGLLKNICEITNFMITKLHFPNLIFLEGLNLLTKDLTFSQVDGSAYIIQ